MSDERSSNAKFRIVHHIKNALRLSIFIIFLLYLYAPNNDCTVCIKREAILSLIVRCSVQDVCITPLGTENNRKEGEKQRKIPPAQGWVKRRTNPPLFAFQFLIFALKKAPQRPAAANPKH